MMTGVVGQPHVRGNGGDGALRRAAREFESMLLADLLKIAEKEKDGVADATGGYDDMRIQAMASALSERGGVGIAKMLISQLDMGKSSQD